MPKFKTLIIDPPWPYDKASKNNKLSGYVTQDGDTKYKTLTIEDLKALPISDVMDPEEAYIFLWTVGPFTEEGYTLLRTWGFEPKSQLCWYKNKGLGVGFWFRGNHELILVGKRPHAPSIRTGESSVTQTDDEIVIEGSVLTHPRLGHSKKPDILHELIEKPRPLHIRKNKAGEALGKTPTTFPGPFLEIFGRRFRDGWTVLGNEAEGDGEDIRESLPKLIERINAVVE